MSWPASGARAGRRSARPGECPARKPSVFISHSTLDGAGHAERLDRALRQNGVPTWLGVRDMNRAADFTSQLEHAIDAADLFIACITSDVRRPDSYVRREIAYAQLCEKPIAVARFAAVPPPISVVTNTFFDFHQDWDAAFDGLLAFCRGGGATPAPVRPAAPAGTRRARRPAGR